MDERNLPTTTNGAVPAMRSPAPGLAELTEEAAPQPGAVLKRALAALLRYKWVILVIAALGTGGTFWGSQFLPLRYQAVTTIWLEVPDRSATAPIQTQGGIPASAWIELLRSFHILDHVAREHGLYLEFAAEDSALMKGFSVDSLFQPGTYRLRVDAQGRTAELQTATGQRLEQVRAGDPIGVSRGFVWQPPASAMEAKRVVTFQVLTPRDAAGLMARRLQVGVPPRGGNVLTLRYTGSEPRQVANVVNAIADRFTAVAIEMKASQQGRLSDALIKQLGTAQDNLTSAERALEDFKIQTATLPTEAAVNPNAPLTQEPSTAMSSYIGYTVQRDNAARDIAAIERALSSEGELSVDLLVSVPSAARSPELSVAMSELTQKRGNLRTLLQTYTPQHATVLKAVADIETLERETIPRLARRLTLELGGDLDRLDSMLAGTARELRTIPTRVLEEARLRRSVTHAERLYSDLRFRYETALLAREATMPDMRILDRATPPPRPQLDPRMKVIAIGFLGSLGLGIVLAFGLDRIDPRFRYAEQVFNDLGLQIVGAVPNLSKNGRGLKAPTKGAEVIEALRGIRLNLIHAYGTAGPLSLTITSPGSGDGKTFITSNLALAFAELGYRTLIIDGDTRRGTMHHLFSLDRRPGLTDFLSTTADLSEVVRTTRFPLVDVLPGGKRMSNGPELLSSQRMGDLLAHIRSEYQVILIDSPPLSAGVDPLVLATVAGHVVVVMRTGVTNRSVAGAKLAMLERLPVRVVGALLNGFESGEAYRYYSYLPGYESAAEDESPDEAARGLQTA